MNDLTELDESIRNQDRDLAALEAGGQRGNHNTECTKFGIGHDAILRADL